MFRLTQEGKWHLRYLKRLLEKAFSRGGTSLFGQIDRQYQCLAEIEEYGISEDYEQLALFLTGSNPVVELVEGV